MRMLRKALPCLVLVASLLTAGQVLAASNGNSNGNTNGNRNGNGGGAPEIDPNMARGVITILVGGMLMLVERRRRR